MKNVILATAVAALAASGASADLTNGSFSNSEGGVAFED